MFPLQGFAFWQKFTLDLQRALSTVETNNLSWYLFLIVPLYLEPMFILPLCTTRLILAASVLFNPPTSMHVSVKVLMKLLVLQQLVTQKKFS